MIFVKNHIQATLILPNAQVLYDIILNILFPHYMQFGCMSLFKFLFFQTHGGIFSQTDRDLY